MKLKHFICLTVTVLSTFFASAQTRVREFPDSIRVEVPAYNAIVTFEMRELLINKQVISGFADSLKTLLPIIRKALPQDVLSLAPQIIDVQYDRTHFAVIAGKERTNGRPLNEKLEITIRQLVPEVTKMRVIQGQVAELLPPAWALVIHHERYRITVYAETFMALENLTREDFTPVLKTIEEDPDKPYIGRKVILARMILKDRGIGYKSIEYKSADDFLGIHFGTAVGLYKGNLYPELFLSTGLYFGNRFGQLRSRIDATIETKFFWPQEEGGRFNATYLSLGYSRNFRKGTERPHWVGFGAGYLVHHKTSIPEGNAFMGPKTLKLFVMSDIGSGKLNLIPEFYFHDLKFDNFDFGLKLTYRF